MLCPRKLEQTVFPCAAGTNEPSATDKGALAPVEGSGHGGAVDFVHEGEVNQETMMTAEKRLPIECFLQVVQASAYPNLTSVDHVEHVIVTLLLCEKQLVGAYGYLLASGTHGQTALACFNTRDISRTACTSLAEMGFRRYWLACTR